MSNYSIKTAESAVKQDKNKRNYKTVTFLEVVMMNTPFGIVQKPATQSRSNKINCYEKNYLNEIKLLKVLESHTVFCKS